MTTGYPFPDMTGPDFLRFYAVMTGIAVMLMLVLRTRLRATGDDRLVGDLNSLQLAYLAGGRDRAVAAVVVGFFSAGAVTIVKRKQLMLIESEGVALPPELEPLRPCAQGMIRYKDFRRAVLPSLEPIHAGLVVRGLCPAPNLLSRYRLAVAAILAVPVLVGLVRAGFGAVRYRPVEYLVALLLVTILFGMILLSCGPVRTRAGDRAVQAAVRRHARAVRAPLTDELALAFALIGPKVLAGTPLAGFAKLASSEGGGGCGGGGGGGGGGCGG